MAKGLVAFTVLVLVALGGWALWQAGGDGPARRDVSVERGRIARLAVAVGRVEPEHEVLVVSERGGTVQRLLVRVGQRVAAGDPVAEIRPVTTTRSEIAAERALRRAKANEAAMAEFVEGEHLLAHLTRWMQGEKNLTRMYQAAVDGREQAEEALVLMRDGSVEVDGRVLDSIVRAPVAGHVLARHARQGDPIVPVSSYGRGTPLVTLADLSTPVFRGTVDEIDVGRLREGMAARVTLGALPGVTLQGELEEIDLKSTARDSSAVFGVRVRLERRDDVLLRAGYSAVAEIQIDERNDTLLLPERVVIFSAGEARVQVRGDAAGEVREVVIETGLSDGLTIEVLSGVAEGDKVLEPLPRQ